jgi:hypothetical protein
LENWITSLNENDFRDKVLMPLFKALGYNNVRNNHGPAELGKDILMSKKHDFDRTENYAVVVKVGKISGNVEGKNTFTTIANQVRMALGSKIYNNSTTKEEKINICYIAVNTQLSQNVLMALKASLSKEFDDDKVKILDYNSMLDYLILYNIHPDRMDELFASFNKLKGKEYIDSITLNRDGSYAVALSKNIPKELHEGKFSLQFTNDEEGLSYQKAYQDFLDHGTFVEIPGKYISKWEFPQIFDRFSSGTSSVEKIALGPNSSNKIFYFDIQLQRGNEHFKLTQLEFKKVASGQKSITFFSDFENTAFTIKMMINEDKSLNFTYNLKKDLSNYTVHELKVFYDFISALYRGGTMEIYDSKTKIRMGLLDVKEKAIPEPDKLVYDLYKKAAFIQEKTNCHFFIPEDGFTNHDYKDFTELYRIISVGYRDNLIGTLPFSTEPTEYFNTKKSSDEIQDIDAVMTRHESCNILGNTIDLGEVDYIIQKGIFKIVEKSATKIKLTITSTEDCPAKAFYKKYYDNKPMQVEPVSSTSPSLS